MKRMGKRLGFWMELERFARSVTNLFNKANVWGYPRRSGRVVKNICCSGGDQVVLGRGRLQS